MSDPLVNASLTKKKINSRQKGQRGERAWRDMLREQGFDSAYRSQQFCGSANSADVICHELPSLHFEVKYTEKFNAYDAINQAWQDAGDKTPVVAHRRNNCDWLVIMKADDWFSLLRETDRVKTIICPDCKSAKVKKNGSNAKLRQQYSCLNDNCARVSFVID